MSMVDDPHGWEDFADLEQDDLEDDFCPDCNLLRDDTGNGAALCSDCLDYLGALQ